MNREMKFSPVTVVLRDGRTILLRHVEVSDAPKVIEFVQGFVYDEEFVPLSEGEFNPTLAEEEQILDNYINRSNSLFLVAETYSRFRNGNAQRMAGLRFGNSIIESCN